MKSGRREVKRDRKKLKKRNSDGERWQADGEKKKKAEAAEKERWKDGERGKRATIKDNERGKDELCIGVTGGQEETNLEGRRCHTDTSSIHLYSDLLYLSHASNQQSDWGREWGSERRGRRWTCEWKRVRWKNPKKEKEEGLMCE